MSNSAGDLRQEAKAINATADVVVVSEAIIAEMRQNLDLLRQFHEDNPSDAFTEAGFDSVQAAMEAAGLTLESVGDSNMADEVSKKAKDKGK